MAPQAVLSAANSESDGIVLDTQRRIDPLKAGRRVPSTIPSSKPSVQRTKRNTLNLLGFATILSPLAHWELFSKILDENVPPRMPKHQMQRATQLPFQLLKDGDATIIKIELPALEPPNDSFQSDWYFSQQLDHSARFVFGKLSAARQSLAAVVEVTFSLLAMKSLNENLDVKNFRDVLDAYITKQGLTPKRGSLDDLQALLKPGVTKEASFAVSAAFVGFSENDAAMSLYRLPPGAELQAQNDLSRLKVTPLVRIDTTTAILQLFAADVRKFSGATP